MTLVRAAKHTPGPWEAVLKDDPREQPAPYYCGLVCLITGGGRGERISVVTDGWCPPEEWEDNARLIASAPELLEALKAVSDMLMGRPDMVAKLHPMMGAAEHAVMEQARAAIAKAEGRS
jgi:hypothetical protein